MATILRGEDNVDSSVIVETNGLAVTDNAIARFDGTTGKLQDSGVIVYDDGNLLLTSGTGALGYGAGAGGTVTQLTSKSTAVTLNKPSGRIEMHNAALATGAEVSFSLNNNLLEVGETLVLTTTGYTGYLLECRYIIGGSANIFVTNKHTFSQSQAVTIQFNVIKGVTA